METTFSISVIRNRYSQTYEGIKEHEILHSMKHIAFCKAICQWMHHDLSKQHHRQPLQARQQHHKTQHVFCLNEARLHADASVAKFFSPQAQGENWIKSCIYWAIERAISYEADNGD